MLLCPELRKVFILVPRTGTGTFYREIMRVYPKSMLLYRHMEADGCPRGYDRWERIGFVRHPLYRLWSLYNFIKNSTGIIGKSSNPQNSSPEAKQADTDLKRSQVNIPFEDWLLNNEMPFMTANDMTGHGEFWPVLTRSHPGPENKISQFQYLRPDLGTTIWKFENLKEHMSDLGLDVTAHKNKSTKESERPPYSDAIDLHLYTFQVWDMFQQCAGV